MVTLQTADPMLDPRVFYQRGTAILMWPTGAVQPSAIVSGPRGSFSTPLSGAPESLRQKINDGDYSAQWSRGYVTVALANWRHK